MTMPEPPTNVIAGIAAHLDLTVEEAHALFADPERAPAIVRAIHQIFGLSDDYDADGPDGLQLFVEGILSEREAKWLDDMVDADERDEGEEQINTGRLVGFPGRTTGTSVCNRLSRHASAKR